MLYTFLSLQRRRETKLYGIQLRTQDENVRPNQSKISHWWIYHRRRAIHDNSLITARIFQWARKLTVASVTADYNNYTTRRRGKRDSESVVATWNDTTLYIPPDKYFRFTILLLLLIHCLRTSSILNRFSCWTCSSLPRLYTTFNPKRLKGIKFIT